MRCWLITTPAAKKAQRASIQPADDKTSQDAANRYLEELNRRTADGKHHRPHCHGYSKFQRYQARRIVHQRFALQDTHDFLRYTPLAYNARKSNGIGWRQHCGQRKSGDQRNPRDQPINHKTNADHRNQYERQCQTEDLSSMLQKLPRWRLPAIGKQQRRNEQNQKQFRVKFHMQTKRRPRQQRANGDLHKG